MLLLKLRSELANSVKKILIHSEDMDKIQTEFPRSGMHTPCSLKCSENFKSPFIIGNMY